LLKLREKLQTQTIVDQLFFDKASFFNLFENLDAWPAARKEH
jgi:hypothetical protein